MEDNQEIQYQKLLFKVLFEGDYRMDRTGVGTYSLFGEQLRFDLSKSFPLLTTKKVFFKAVVVELLWFLSGDTNTEFLLKNGVTIWDEWADGDGNLGPIYGKQWRRWEGRQGHIDQIADVIERLKNDPYSRRHLVNAWNVADLPFMALSPCHCLFQFFVSQGKLSCQLYQRSADLFLGVPFNIASYALLTHMIANQTGLEVGELIMTFGDVHIYANHKDQVQEQINRLPMEPPKIFVPHRDSIDDYTVDDIKILNYHSHPAISAPIAI